MPQSLRCRAVTLALSRGNRRRRHVLARSDTASSMRDPEPPDPQSVTGEPWSGVSWARPTPDLTATQSPCWQSTRRCSTPRGTGAAVTSRPAWARPATWAMVAMAEFLIGPGARIENLFAAVSFVGSTSSRPSSRPIPRWCGRADRTAW